MNETYVVEGVEGVEEAPLAVLEALLGCSEAGRQEESLLALIVICTPTQNAQLWRRGYERQDKTHRSSPALVLLVVHDGEDDLSAGLQVGLPGQGSTVVVVTEISTVDVPEMSVSRPVPCTETERQGTMGGYCSVRTGRCCMGRSQGQR